MSKQRSSSPFPDPVTPVVTPARVTEPSTPDSNGIETQRQVGGIPQGTSPEVSSRRVRKGRAAQKGHEGPSQGRQGVSETSEQGAGSEGDPRSVARPGAAQDDLSGSQGAIHSERALEPAETLRTAPSERTGVTETPSVAEHIISTLAALENEPKRAGIVLWVGNSLHCKRLALTAPVTLRAGWPFHVKRSA